MAICIDSTTRVDPAALEAAGVTDVCRYLSWPHWWGGASHSTTNPKIIQQAEVDELIGHGFGLTLNWEYDQHDWLTGAAGGKAHGDQAVAMARERRYPAGCVIAGSADFDMSWAQWTGAGRPYGIAYAAAVRAGGYDVGVYGSCDTLLWATEEPNIRPRLLWQCMSTGYAGGRNARPLPGVQLWQRRPVRIGGVQVDQSDILSPSWGQWRAGGVDMEQTDPVVGAYARQGQRVGDVLADQANMRDWLYDHPDQEGGNPPPAGSRLDLIYQAATRPAGLPPEVVAQLVAAMPTAGDIARAILTELRPAPADTPPAAPPA